MLREVREISEAVDEAEIGPVPLSLSREERCLNQIIGGCPHCSYDPENNPDCDGYQPVSLYFI